MTGRIEVGVIVDGPLLPEPIRVLALVPLGASVKLIGQGLRSNQVHDPILTPVQLDQLTVTPLQAPFDGDPARFRLGIEAQRLALAYEYDPYFSLSIARVDPLPHQLEAVYDYFLKMPRIRFLLADDPGAGKTIMAGLLLKELKARGIVKRTLVVAPANLTFQWQRELKDKFAENFSVIRSEQLRANYGVNPWQEQDQAITSVSWVSVIEEARESLLRSRWDLVIVDEAHRMAAYAEDRKTLAYQLGERLSDMTDHYLLMTATPHKGDPENFTLFLALLDRDVYADVSSLKEAMARNRAPFYLRRTKEALVTFPDENGVSHKIFTKRDVQTVKFTLDGPEMDFYDALTRYVEDQSIEAAKDNNQIRGRALAFAMAMLQRRMASSVYAVRRSLERMRDRRERILNDPEGFRREVFSKRIPDDFDELEESDQQALLEEIENVVASYDPEVLRREVAEIGRLVAEAKALEQREVETKLVKLKALLTSQGVFDDPTMKLLVFTEHKDTLDYLAGDGRDGRPFGKLREWGLSVTQIHGGMKIGDRDAPGSRIYAEREFRESAQVLVATEAAGEGINLQFCWFMINYDIPWNPVRLEQRMGRIHRYGQLHDCVIFNFAAVNTSEGRVLAKLLDRLDEIRRELGSDQVFDVVGEVLPAASLERMFRDLYQRNRTVADIEQRIAADVNPEAFRRITESALEGLAKRQLNLSALVGRRAEAKERRLVPEVIADFFVQAAPLSGLPTRPVSADGGVYRIGRVPRSLLTLGDELEPRYGRLGRNYDRVVFDKTLLPSDPRLEWVTPGHPLFEVVREAVARRVANDLRQGAVFFDLQREQPSQLDIFAASIKDGRGRPVHRRLFVVEADGGGMTLRQPTLFLDLVPAPGQTPPQSELAGVSDTEAFLLVDGLEPFLTEVAADRQAEVGRIAVHVELALKALIDRAQLKHAELLEQQTLGISLQGIEGRLAQAETHLDELNARLDRRLAELDKERECVIGDVVHIGRAWVLPHPERTTPVGRPMVSDPEIERIAVECATAYEIAQGRVVESVEKDNRGFDLVSRLPHPEDPASFVDVRFIEVKGRAATGDVALSTNEFKTAQRLKGDFWLYAVFDAATSPRLVRVQDPSRLGWMPIVQIEHYRLDPRSIENAQTGVQHQ